ncbi:MAG: hypothetical protein NZM25_06375 [Leptospiraceae bacterium]|nr:hypothetical protein [Leptospiraceae bacterium]MDW8306599.1 hypothetical protein [Leptospiraceae bacterium]
MDPQKRAQLIRQGNLLFNKGDIETAAKIFKATNYRDGLIRVGDYFYFEKHEPLRAYGYYRQAGHEKGLQKIHMGFIFALKCWLYGEVNPKKKKEEEKNPKSTPVEKEAYRRPPHLGDDYITPTRPRK